MAVEVTMMTQIVDIDDEGDDGFSTMPRWSNNWLRSCKINDRWLQDIASLVSRPPTPSRPLIKTGVVPLSPVDQPVYEIQMLRSEVEWFPQFIPYREYYLPTMPRDEEGSVIQDKATLKCVTACQGWRDVQTILGEYREMAFSDLVYMIRICTKIHRSEPYCNRMDYIITLAFKTSSWLSQEPPRQLVEWDL